MEIILYNNSYKEDYHKLIRELWNDIVTSEIDQIIEDHKKTDNKVFLAIENSVTIGFLNTSIRSDYVEGSETSPTGYIEGIYVLKKYRKQQVAYQLLQHSFDYFKSIGITEVGSDIELDNHVSKTFHEKVGFMEVSTNIHYIIKIK